MNIRKMIKTQIFCVGVVSLLFGTFTYSANDEAYIIFNNISGSYDAAIFSNMATSKNESCTKNKVLTANMCNRFALGQNEIQVIQNDGSGQIVSMIGVKNDKSTSYKNKGTKNQSYLFSKNKYLFNIDKLRTIANNISTLEPNLPSGSYGTISFQQFVNNIAKDQTMYGIVRVKIPLLDTAIKKPAIPPANDNDDGDDDGNGDSSDDDGGDKKSSHNSDDDSDNDSDDDSNGGSDDSSDDDSSHVPKFKMCGDAGVSACANVCGLGKKSIIEAGMKLCGVTLPEFAQINIMGALLIDWVNYKTKDIIELDAFPSDPQEVSFEIALPLNINPSNVHKLSQTMSSIQAIQKLTGSNQCETGSVCDVEITTDININLVPLSSRELFKYKFSTTLTKEIFDNLSRADQYYLLFPSGYADGWNTALNALNVSDTQWQNWGLYVESDKNGKITVDSIRNDSFEDIPALIYTGGLVRITHHTNISGLIYAAQAIEINQKGSGDENELPIPDIKTCTPPPFDDDSNDDSSNDDGAQDDDGKDDDGNKDDDSNNTCGAGNDDGSSDDSSSDDNSNNDDGSSDDSSSDDNSTSDDGSSDDNSSDDNSSNDDGSDDAASDDDSDSSPALPIKPVTPSNPNTKFIPSFQYIDGAIVVRDGFYFEAIKPHGITLINNNPDTYSNTEIKRIGGKNNFMSYSDPRSKTNNENDDSILSRAQSGADKIRANGAKWVEIRPQ